MQDSSGVAVVGSQPAADARALDEVIASNRRAVTRALLAAGALTVPYLLGLALAAMGVRGALSGLLVLAPILVVPALVGAAAALPLHPGVRALASRPADIETLTIRRVTYTALGAPVAHMSTLVLGLRGGKRSPVNVPSPELDGIVAALRARAPGMRMVSDSAKPKPDPIQLVAFGVVWTLTTVAMFGLPAVVP